MIKKGSITYIAWTIFLMIFVAIGFVVLLILDAKESFAGTSPYTVDYLAANNKPQLLSSQLTQTILEDRQFMEHATEIIATGNDGNSSSDNLDIYMKDFFRKHSEISFISVSIKSVDAISGKELFYVDNVPKKCGDDFSGFCVPSKRTYSTRPDGESGYAFDIGCTDGRVKIATEKYAIEENKCKSKNEACCVEGREVTNVWPSGTITCGFDGREEGEIDQDDPGVCDYIGGISCSPGRISIDDISNECVRKGGLVGVCCAPLISETLVESNLASVAEIPLFYKDKKGIVEVTVR